LQQQVQDGRAGRGLEQVADEFAHDSMLQLKIVIVNAVLDRLVDLIVCDQQWR
jgi:hypothetical protein